MSLLYLHQLLLMSPLHQLLVNLQDDVGLVISCKKSAENYTRAIQMYRWHRDRVVVTLRQKPLATLYSISKSSYPVR